MSREELDAQAENARKLANVLLDLSAVISRSPGSGGYSGDYRNMLSREVRGLLQFRPLWWQTLCSPRCAWLFAHERQRMKLEETLGVRDHRRVSGLVCRLRFGYVLDPVLVSVLNQYVDSGRLTARDAWRLTHSLGCRVVRGTIEPSPISRAVASVGAVSTAVVLALCVALSYGAIASWFDPDRNLCGFLGHAVLAYAAAHVAPALMCLTWGRRDAGLFLDRLLSGQVSKEADTALLPSLARLTW